MTNSGIDWLLRFYPRSFRERYGAELRAFVVEDHERARSEGGIAWRPRFWIRAVSDALLASVRLRVAGGGGLEVVAGGVRARRRRMGVLVDVARDGRHTVRAFRRQPGFHGLAVLTVALGVAATTAAFSVLDRVARRPLPYPEPERLVEVSSVMRHDPEAGGPLSHPDVLLLRERSRLLETTVAVERRERVLLGVGEPRRVVVTAGSEGLFEVLGARAALGRLFIAEDHEPGANPVAVLSHETWSVEYGASREVLGRPVRIDGTPYEVVGVLSGDFLPPEAVAGSPEYWTALRLNAAAEGSFGSSVIARLAEGATPVAAQAETSGLMQQAYADESPPFILGARVTDLRAATIGDIGGTLWLFLGAVTLLLAIACTNVANLMLARGADRADEVGVRTALGASRGRVVRQLLTESLLIALAGGAVGAVAAYALVNVLVMWAPGGIPRLAEVSVDARALTFALAISCLTGVLFGLAPALHAARGGAGSVLTGGRRTTTTRGANRLRSGLVVAETALALMLVLVAGLLVNSFVRMRTADPGFPVEGLAAMQVDLRAGYEDRTTWTPFWNELLERASALPGVRSASLSAFTPFLDFPLMQAFTPEGADIGADESVFLPSSPVSAGWERTLGLRLLEGRSFDGTERADGTPVVLVNRALAQAYWPGEAEVTGRRIKSGSLASEDDTWYTVIGVVSDARHSLVQEATPTVYHPHSQVPWRRMSVLVRVDGDAAPVLTALRDAVHSIDETLPVQRAGLVSRLASESVLTPRFYSSLSAGFGALALALAIVGIHGTAAWATARRSREIGIRLALGAEPRSIRSMLTLNALRLALWGVAIGMAAALAGTRFLQTYLFDLSPTDPFTFVTAAAAIALTAAAAAWLPARRASRLDPVVTLRSEH